MIVLTEGLQLQIITGFPLQVSEVIDASHRSLVTHIYYKLNDRPIQCFKNAMEIVLGADRTGQANKLLIVATDRLTQAACMTWTDRITKLTREGEWIKALCLAIQFAEVYILFLCVCVCVSVSVYGAFVLCCVFLFVLGFLASVLLELIAKCAKRTIEKNGIFFALFANLLPVTGIMVFLYDIV